MKTRLKEKLAIERILKICNEISTEDEIISFLGWKDGKFTGYKTILILHNSKYNETWSTASFNNFTSHPSKRSKDRMINEIKNNPRNRKNGNQVLNEIKNINKDKNWTFPENFDNYKNNKTKITIFCNEIDKLTGKVHGEFTTDSTSLLHSKVGCPKCSGCHHFTTEEFIERAKIVHGNKYTYEKTVYINNRTKIIITCPVHGDFEIIPDNFIRRKDGCKKCSNSKGELALIKELERLKISYINHSRVDSSKIENCPNKNYVEIDFKLNFEDREIWIEFQGEQHYHESPGRFHDHRRKDRTFSEQIQRDNSIREYAKANNIEFLEIPWVDIDRIPEILEAFLYRQEDITTKIDIDYDNIQT